MLSAKPAPAPCKRTSPRLPRGDRSRPRYWPLTTGQPTDREGAQTPYADETAGLVAATSTAVTSLDERRITELIDTIAFGIGAMQTDVARTNAQRDTVIAGLTSRIEGLEIRTAATERGLETAIRCADVAAGALQELTLELHTREARLRMTECALERLYGALDVLSVHLAGVAGAMRSPIGNEA